MASICKNFHPATAQRTWPNLLSRAVVVAAGHRCPGSARGGGSEDQQVKSNDPALHEVARVLRSDGVIAAARRELSPPVRLLVIDDEPAMLRSTARLLKRNAPLLEVSLAEGAARGLDQINKRAPDAVLVDFHMPELTGIELCLELKQLPLTADVIVILFSGLRDPVLEREAKRAGAVALLEKPPAVRELLDLLENHCRRRLNT